MQELGETEADMVEVLKEKESKPSNLFKLVEFFEKPPYKLSNPKKKETLL